MFFEPESWTGLRSSNAIAQDFSPAEVDKAAEGAPRTALRSLATRIGAIVDWSSAMTGRHAPARSQAPTDFLNERRVFILGDAGR